MTSRLRARLQKEREHGFQDVIQSVLAILPHSNPSPAGNNVDDTPPPRSPIALAPISEGNDRPVINAGTRPRLPAQQAPQPQTANIAQPPVKPQQANVRPPVQLPPHFLADPAWKEWADFHNVCAIIPFIHLTQTDETNSNGGQDKILQVIKESEDAQRAHERNAAQQSATQPVQQRPEQPAVRAPTPVLQQRPAQPIGNNVDTKQVRFTGESIREGNLMDV